MSIKCVQAIADMIKSERNKRQWSQQSLCDRLLELNIPVSKPQMSKVERGIVPTPRYQIILGLMQLFDWTLEDLFKEEN